mgnify:FL=1
MRAPLDPDIMSAADVADMLGLKEQTVTEAAARGELPHRKIGRRYLFSRRAITSWIHGMLYQP